MNALMKSIDTLINKPTYYTYISLGFIGLSLCLIPANSHASATASDFKPCQKIAVKSLKHCLATDPQKSAGKVNSNKCWKASQQGYEVCVAKVVKRYNPDELAKRQSAKRKAEQALMNQRKVEDSQK